MIDAIIIFILTYTLTAPFLIGIFLLCLIFEYKESSGWSFVAAGIAALVAYKLYSIPSHYILYAGVAYIPIGVGWSLWRWKSHCNRTLAEYQAFKTPDVWERKDALIATTLTQQKARITSWIIGWPWGILVNLLRDIMTFIESLVTKHLRAVYENISSDARSKIEQSEGKDI